jgi:hypothetical protein
VFLFGFYVNSLAFNALGHAFIAILPNILAATQVLGIVFTLLMLFGGVFAGQDAIPPGWKWLYIINPVPKALAAMAMPQFMCHPNTPENCPPPPELSQFHYRTLQDYVARFLDLSAPEDSFTQIAYVVLIMAVLRVIAILSLQFISHIKR